MFLFNKRNNRASISVGLMTNMVPPANCVFDKGAGPNPIREAFLGAEWLRATQAKNQPALKTLTNQKVSIIGSIILHVRK